MIAISPARRQQALAVVLLLCLTGCGQNGTGLVRVTGKVTFDGQPVPEGAIIFTAAGTSGSRDGGPIVNGEYAVNVSPGSKQVEIIANRPSPGSTNPTQIEQYLPTKYNSETTLKAEVNSRNAIFDFELTSK